MTPSARPSLNQPILPILNGDVAGLDEAGCHSADGSRGNGHDFGQLSGACDSSAYMLQHRILRFIGPAPQRERRGGGVEGPEEGAGVGAGAVAAFGELGAEGGAVGGLARVSGFFEAEDPVRHVLAAAAAAHLAVAPGVVDDEDGDAPVAQGEKPVADGIERVVVVFGHAELGGGEVVDDEEAAIHERGGEGLLVDEAGDIDAVAA